VRNMAVLVFVAVLSTTVVNAQEPVDFVASSSPQDAISVQFKGMYIERADTLWVVVTEAILQVPDSLSNARLHALLVYADDCVGGRLLPRIRRTAKAIDWHLHSPVTSVTDTLGLIAPVPALGADTCLIRFQLADYTGIRATLVTDRPVQIGRSDGN
jgi:hypothetical protein